MKKFLLLSIMFGGICMNAAAMNKHVVENEESIQYNLVQQDNHCDSVSAARGKRTKINIPTEVDTFFSQMCNPKFQKIPGMISSYAKSIIIRKKKGRDQNIVDLNCFKKTVIEEYFQVVFYYGIVNRTDFNLKPFISYIFVDCKGVLDDLDLEKFVYDICYYFCGLVEGKYGNKGEEEKEVEIRTKFVNAMTEYYPEFDERSFSMRKIYHNCGEFMKGDYMKNLDPCELEKINKFLFIGDVSWVTTSGEYIDRNIRCAVYEDRQFFIDDENDHSFHNLFSGVKNFIKDEHIADEHAAARYVLELACNYCLRAFECSKYNGNKQYVLTNLQAEFENVFKNTLGDKDCSKLFKDCKEKYFGSDASTKEDAKVEVKQDSLKEMKDESFRVKVWHNVVVKPYRFVKEKIVMAYKFITAKILTFNSWVMSFFKKGELKENKGDFRI